MEKENNQKINIKTELIDIPTYEDTHTTYTHKETHDTNSYLAMIHSKTKIYSLDAIYTYEHFTLHFTYTYKHT